MPRSQNSHLTNAIEHLNDLNPLSDTSPTPAPLQVIVRQRIWRTAWDPKATGDYTIYTQHLGPWSSVSERRQSSTNVCRRMMDRRSVIGWDRRRSGQPLSLSFKTKIARHERAHGLSAAYSQVTKVFAPSHAIWLELNTHFFNKIFNSPPIWLKPPPLWRFIVPLSPLAKPNEVTSKYQSQNGKHILSTFSVVSGNNQNHQPRDNESYTGRKVFQTEPGCASSIMIDYQGGEIMGEQCKTRNYLITWFYWKADIKCDSNTSYMHRRPPYNLLW